MKSIKMLAKEGKLANGVVYVCVCDGQDSWKIAKTPTKLVEKLMYGWEAWHWKYVCCHSQRKKCRQRQKKKKILK